MSEQSAPELQPDTASAVQVIVHCPRPPSAPPLLPQHQARPREHSVRSPSIPSPASTAPSHRYPPAITTLGYALSPHRATGCYRTQGAGRKPRWHARRCSKCQFKSSLNQSRAPEMAEPSLSHLQLPSGPTGQLPSYQNQKSLCHHLEAQRVLSICFNFFLDGFSI